jgi:hypothetical protein
MGRRRHIVALTAAIFGITMIHARSSWACSEDVEMPSVPIKVGGRFTGHNCTPMALTQATVVPMKAGSYLAVRTAPGVSAAQLDRLVPSTPVIICTGLTNSQWVGVLYYEPGTEDQSPYGVHDCGLSGADSKKQSVYRGPCRSGWVARRYLMLSAG